MDNSRRSHAPPGDASGRPTPWGSLGELRAAAQPRPAAPDGRHGSRVAPSDELLFAAFLTQCVEQGYATCDPASISVRAGCPERDLIARFPNAEVLALAVIDELSSGWLAALEAAAAAHQAGPQRLRALLAKSAELAAAQPSAARFWALELPGAGTRALARRAAFNRRLAERVRAELAITAGPAGSPHGTELADALLGGIQRVFRSRVRADECERLPELVEPLWSWATGYAGPGADLSRARPSADPGPWLRVRPSPAGRASDRIIAATINESSRCGFHHTSARSIADSAEVPLESFQDHFDDHHEAFLTALEIVQSRAYRATLPAYRRASDWPQAMRALFVSSAALLDRDEPAARLALLEAPSAGADALERHVELLRRLEELLRPGFDLRPELPPVVAEAIAGAVVSLAAAQLRRGGGERAPVGFAPLATYIALAPFVGDEVATLLAGDPPPDST